MKVLFVYAHEDPKSFGAAIHSRTLGFFEKSGHTVVVSDLYGSGFHPVAAKWDFVISGGANQDYSKEQKRAAAKDSAGFATDITDEIAKLRAADLVVFEFPLWWSAPPAIIKGWFDKVFAMGVVWDHDHRYGSGLLAGKQALVVTGVNDSQQNYATEGIHRASVDQHLYPLLHTTLAQAGFDVHKPYVAYSVDTLDEAEQRGVLDELDAYLNVVVSSPVYIYRHS